MNIINAIGWIGWIVAIVMAIWLIRKIIKVHRLWKEFKPIADERNRIYNLAISASDRKDEDEFNELVRQHRELANECRRKLDEIGSA